MHQWYLAHRQSELEKNRQYYRDNTEKCKELCREHKKRHPEKAKVYRHRLTMKNLPRELGKIIAWKRENKERAREADREYCRRVKQDFVNAYGGRCCCCGESIFEFLTCEHLNKEHGTQDRKHGVQGPKIYLRAKREGYPKDKYTLLCMNCNYAERFGKTCPHKSQRLRAGISLVDKDGLREIAG